MIACQLVKSTHFDTRGHHLRLFKKHVQYDLLNAILEIVRLLHTFGIICLIIAVMLTQLVYLRID